MLHVTNGDSAAGRIRQAGIPGELLPWREVLHEGPVPAGVADPALREIRARFIAACGWDTFDRALQVLTAQDEALARFRDHEEVVLWFEHDLYDQLQLIQILDRFAGKNPGATRLRLIAAPDYLGPMPPDRIAALYDTRKDVTPEQLTLGRAAWRAFRAPDPALISALLRQDTRALPFLADALVRHLEEFPALRNGLSRTERQILETVAEGWHVLAEAYTAAHHARERRIFLGDTPFLRYVEELSRPEQPLLVLENGPVPAHRLLDRFRQERMSITELGRQVLSGQEDRIAVRGIDRWLGGVHLAGRRVPWRWDPAGRQIVSGGA